MLEEIKKNKTAFMAIFIPVILMMIFMTAVAIWNTSHADKEIEEPIKTSENK